MKKCIIISCCILAIVWLGRQWLNGRIYKKGDITGPFCVCFDSCRETAKKLGVTIVIKAFEHYENPIRLNKGDLLIIEQDGLEFPWPIHEDLIITGPISVDYEGEE